MQKSGVLFKKSSRQALCWRSLALHYAADRNPMAVELCKVALWIEALEPGKPMTFLDSHIRCGDSLIGVLIMMLRDGIPDEVQTASRRRQRKHESVCQI